MIGNKEEMVLQYCKNKEVLDIGCVELLNNFNKDNLKKTLHYKIHGVAKRLVGIDLEEEGVKGFNQIGCKCYFSMAEKINELNLGKFDVILLGDIIEHIPNAANFLTSIRNSLKPNGIIVCTTPNSLAYSNFLSILINKPITRRQHVAWYCKITLSNLFKLSGYKLHEMHYCNYVKTAHNPIRKLLDLIFCNIREELSPHLFGVFKIVDSVNLEEIQKQRIFYQQ